MPALVSHPTQVKSKLLTMVCKVWGDMTLACIYCLFTQISGTTLGLPEMRWAFLLSFILNFPVSGTCCLHLWRAGSSCFYSFKDHCFKDHFSNHTIKNKNKTSIPKSFYHVIFFPLIQPKLPCLLNYLIVYPISSPFIYLSSVRASVYTFFLIHCLTSSP